MDEDRVRVPAACIGCVTADDVQAEPEYRAWIVHVHPECPVHGELIALRAEVRRLQVERDRMGTLPFEAAFLVHGEPEQLIFRGPTGQVVLRRVRNGEA